MCVILTFQKKIFKISNNFLPKKIFLGGYNNHNNSVVCCTAKVFAGEQHTELFKQESAFANSAVIAITIIKNKIWGAHDQCDLLLATSTVVIVV